MSDKAQGATQNPDHVCMHERALAITHTLAFVGTGLTWLAMIPNPRVSISRITGDVPRGAFLMTFLSVLWVSWPYLASYFVGKPRLAGRASPTWKFACLVAGVAIAGGFALDVASTSNWPMFSSFQIAMLEAVCLISAAKAL